MATVPSKEQLTGNVTAGEFKQGLNQLIDAVTELDGQSTSLNNTYATKVEVNKKAATTYVDTQDQSILRQAKAYTDAKKPDMTGYAKSTDVTQVKIRTY